MSLNITAKLILISAFFISQSALGQALYSYVDENGVRIFTNIPPKAQVRDLKVTGLPRSQVEPEKASELTTSRSTAYEPIIQKYAGEFRLDPALISSMIAAESGFDPKAVSRKGAQGLMQLMPATAARVGVRDVFDPEENIRGGMKHMRTLLDTFNNDIPLSLAAYNAGENLVQRIGRIPDIRETHDYVSTITKRYGKTHVNPQPDDAKKVAPLFRYTDKSGVLHLTNIPPTRQSDTLPLIVGASGQAPE